MLLCETWHDANSVSIDQLCANGYSIVKRARSRRVDASLSVNHGGVAIVKVAGVRPKTVNVGVSLLTFEYAAARLTSIVMPGRRHLPLWIICGDNQLLH